ncbi:MAG TPA: DUF2330 domain-containing protein [Polyangia bacterium]|nr:DUF2330 domain-containing protein [Polyangia bacterium]
MAAALLAAGGGAAMLVGEPRAAACGGLFCNSRPPDPFAPLPVAQNGENVVFSITPDPAGGAPTLVAHIQILYTGDAPKFSWVVPVDAAPTLSVGTDRLFSALNTATQPQFQASRLTDGTCIPQQNFPSGGSGGATSSGGAVGSAGSGGTSGNGGVTVSFQGAVGPFDAAVIKSDDPIALKMWLADNGYVVSDAAAALIDAYVHENKFFVALKLLNGVGVRSIQPIVLTFRGTEACVPLRLTAIAANPDMPVLVWVLGSKRVVPKAFFEIKIDEASIAWDQNGANYFGPNGLVSKAANEAGGNAFVAEYAGSSTIARNAVYSNGQFNVASLQAAMTPPVYVQQVIQMGLASDPVMLSLLAKYIPMPDAVKTMGVTESQFYGNLQSYWTNYAFPAYDLAGLTGEIMTKIIQPRIDAQMMIDQHPYLTRLNTFISPDEMNTDPLFFESANLPDVSNVHTAVLRSMCGNMDYLACNAPVRMELADGRMAWVRAGSKSASCTYVPFNQPATLPTLEMAWERALTGEGTRMIDNTTKIDAAINANNALYTAEQTQFPIPLRSVGAGGAGGGSAATGGTGGRPVVTGTGGVFGTGGTGGSVVPGTGGMPADATGVTPDSGCACNLGTGTGTGMLGVWLGLGLALGRRRRR